jgi:hypothetical protein
VRGGIEREEQEGKRGDVPRSLGLLGVFLATISTEALPESRHGSTAALSCAWVCYCMGGGG